MIFSLNQSRTGSEPNTSALFAERRLTKACEYVSKFWFPANPIVLDRIRTGLQRGMYPNVALVFEDIRSDFAIYSYCIKSLSQSYFQQVEKPNSLSILGLFEWAGVPGLSSLFVDGGLDRAPHSLSSISSDQVFHLGFAHIVASSAATFLCSDADKSEGAYAAGLLRHLGINLIAWNYPQVFQEALACVSPEEPLDMVLERVLGFTSHTLSARLAKEWHLNPSIEYAVISDAEQLDALDMAQTAFSELLRACSLGEAIAQANSPGMFQSAARNWSVVRPEIEKRLGRSGLVAIKQALSQNVQAYIKLSPRTFAALEDLDPESKLPVIVAEPEVATVDEGVKARLAELLEPLYARYEAGKVNIELVQQLIREVMPKLGFEGGCIYVVDPANEVLAPRIKIGKLRLQAFRAVSYAESVFELSPVRNAFNAREPLLSGGNSSEGAISCIAGHLGNQSKAGVLYLECAAKESQEVDQLLTQQFNALREALNKFLMLP
jgi:hypothetical protein